MKIIKYYFFFFILLFAVFANANSYTVKSVPNPYNQVNVIYVVDPDNILTKHDADIINERLKLLETRTTIETAVVALPSIGSVDTREFANKLFNHWQIGKKEKDNGLLVLLVLDQREVVFEVGYGLEGNLTDAKSYRLMDQYMLPQFRQNQFSEGMRVGIDGVASYLEQQFYDGTLYRIGINTTPFGITTSIIICILLFIAVYCFWGDKIFANKKKHVKKPYISPLERLQKVLFVILLTFPFLIFSLIFTENASIILIIFLFYPIIGIIAFIIMRILNNPNRPEICNRCMLRTVVMLDTDLPNMLKKKEHYQYNIKSVTYSWFKCTNQKCQNIYYKDSINYGWISCRHCQLVAMKYQKTRIERTATLFSDGKGYEIYCCIKCSANIQVPFIIESEQTKRKHLQNTTSNSGYHSNNYSSGGFRGGGRSGGGGARGRF